MQIILNYLYYTTCMPSKTVQTLLILDDIFQFDENLLKTAIYDTNALDLQKCRA